MQRTKTAASIVALLVSLVLVCAEEPAITTQPVATPSSATATPPASSSSSSSSSSSHATSSAPTMQPVVVDGPRLVTPDTGPDTTTAVPSVWNVDSVRSTQVVIDGDNSTANQVAECLSKYGCNGERVKLPPPQPVDTEALETERKLRAEVKAVDQTLEQAFQALQAQQLKQAVRLARQVQRQAGKLLRKIDEADFVNQERAQASNLNNTVAQARLAGDRRLTIYERSTAQVIINEAQLDNQTAYSSVMMKQKNRIQRQVTRERQQQDVNNSNNNNAGAASSLAPSAPVSSANSAAINTIAKEEKKIEKAVERLEQREKKAERLESVGSYRKMDQVAESVSAKADDLNSQAKAIVAQTKALQQEDPSAAKALIENAKKVSERTKILVASADALHSTASIKLQNQGNNSASSNSSSSRSVKRVAEIISEASKVQQDARHHIHKAQQRANDGRVFSAELTIDTATTLLGRASSLASKAEERLRSLKNSGEIASQDFETQQQRAKELRGLIKADQRLIEQVRDVVAQQKKSNAKLDKLAERIRQSASSLAEEAETVHKKQNEVAQASDSLESLASRLYMQEVHVIDDVQKKISSASDIAASNRQALQTLESRLKSDNLRIAAARP